MSTPHINAVEGAFAKTVLMPGDPLRAKFIAENFLDNPQLVTSVRNVLGFTGTYNGVAVSVMASGMGMPSIGIYSHELFQFYDVESIIRIGSAGSYSSDLKVSDVVLASSAYSTSSYAQVHNGETPASISTKQLYLKLKNLTSSVLHAKCIPAMCSMVVLTASPGKN